MDLAPDLAVLDAARRALHLDDGTWRRVVGFQRATLEKDFVHIDYASGDGSTLHFGDGDFGKVPADGLRFRVDYRTGPGSASNLGAGTIRNLRHPVTLVTDLPALLGDIDSVTNPLPVTYGVDPESLEDVRQLAPEEFRAITHRAVKPEDFCEIARRLDWVQIAGVRQRWTGSWPTTFVTPDPVAAYGLTDDQRAELTGLMDCVRQAGREAHVRDPRFRAIDLEIQICIKPGHLPSSVRDAVLFRLLGDGPRRGFDERPRECGRRYGSRRARASWPTTTSSSACPRPSSSRRCSPQSTRERAEANILIERHAFLPLPRACVWERAVTEWLAATNDLGVALDRRA